MSVVTMDFRGSVGQKQPSLFKPDRMAEALGDFAEREAPVGRRKWLVKHFGLSDDDARRVVERRASKAIIDRVFQRGGWPVIIEVFAIFTGEQIDQHLERERRRHAERAERLGALVGDFRPRRGVGDLPAPRRAVGNAGGLGVGRSGLGTAADEDT